MDLVAKLGSNDAKVRDAADAELRQLDRFAEAILQRVLDNAQQDETINQRIEQILAALEQERRQGKAPKPRP